MSEQRDAIAAAVAAANEGNFDGYMALYDPTVVLHGYGPGPIGYDEAKGFYAALLGALSDSHLAIDDLIEEGDKIAVRFTLSGTHSGELMGVQPTGQPIILTGQAFFRFTGNKVVERWQSADMLGLMVQLGAVPAPA